MKKLKILGFVIAGLATLLAFAWAVENFRGYRAWAACQAELKAAGDPLTMSELLPPAVPDDQNFAKTPLLAPLHDYGTDPQTHAVAWRDTNALRRAQSGFSWWIDRREIGPRWRLGEFVDWKAWQEEMRGRTNSPELKSKALLARQQGHPEDDVMFLLDQSRAEMEEISQALKRPHSVFAVHYEESVSALLPELAVLRGFAQAFRARALVRLTAGQVNEAFADTDAILGLADAPRSEPLLISQLVRIAILEFAAQPVWEGMVRHQWTAAQLGHLQGRLAEVNLAADVRRVMQGERVGAVMAVDYMRLRGVDVLSDQDAPWLRWMPSGWYAQNKVVIVRAIQDLMLPSFDVAHRRFDLELAQRSAMELERQIKPARPYTIIASMFLPSLSGAVRKAARGQATVDLAMVACGLERHRLAQGRYPERLEDLVPSQMAALPEDPVSWQPLHYRREGDQGYVLYAVGLNRADDHGTPAKDKRGVPQPDKPEGDWVWRVGSASR